MTEQSQGLDYGLIGALTDIGAAIVLAVLLAIATDWTGDAAPRPIVVAALYATPGVIALLGVIAQRPWLLLAGGLPLLPAAGLAASGATFVFLVPAVLMILGASRMLAKPDACRLTVANGVAAAVITTLILIAGYAVLIASDCVRLPSGRWRPGVRRRLHLEQWPDRRRCVPGPGYRDCSCRRGPPQVAQPPEPTLVGRDEDPATVARVDHGEVAAAIGNSHVKGIGRADGVWTIPGQLAAPPGRCLGRCRAAARGRRGPRGVDQQRAEVAAAARHQAGGGHSSRPWATHQRMLRMPSSSATAARSRARHERRRCRRRSSCPSRRARAPVARSGRCAGRRRRRARRRDRRAPAGGSGSARRSKPSASSARPTVVDDLVDLVRLGVGDPPPAPGGVAVSSARTMPCTRLST